MTLNDTARAWTDLTYLESLSEAEKLALAAHPAGSLAPLAVDAETDGVDATLMPSTQGVCCP